MKTTTELLNLRWRAAQLLLARRDRDIAQAEALVAAMSIEGVDYADAAAELDLLAHQFAHRGRWYLAAEVDRLAGKLRMATT